MLASVVFVLFHIGAQPMTPLTISSMAVAGVLLGVVYQRTRSLWAVVILHGAIDVGVLWLQSSAYQPFVVMLGVWCALLAALGWWSLDRSRERMGL
jgi:membrane protease YdiL (CAAX protease family)